MKWSCAAALPAALLLTSCGETSTPPTARLVRTHGVLMRLGGPAPGAPVALRGVVVRFRGEGESAMVHTDHRGRFSFDAAPGTYRVTIAAGGPQTGPGPIQPFPHVIRVPRPGRLRLVVNIK